MSVFSPDELADPSSMSDWDLVRSYLALKRVTDSSWKSIKAWAVLSAAVLRAELDERGIHASDPIEPKNLSHLASAFPPGGEIP